MKTELATWMGGVASSLNAWWTGVQTHSALLEATCISTISGLGPRPPTSVIWVMYLLVRRYVLICVIGIISPFRTIFTRFSGSDYLLWTGRRVVKQNSVLSICGLWSSSTSRPRQLRSFKQHYNCWVGGQVRVRWGPLARRAVGALLHQGRKMVRRSPCLRTSHMRNAPGATRLIRRGLWLQCPLEDQVLLRSRTHHAWYLGFGVPR